jgi:hypothetical protein
MAIQNPITRRPSVVQVYDVNIAYMALPNLVIRQLCVVQIQTGCKYFTQGAPGHQENQHGPGTENQTGVHIVSMAIPSLAIRRTSVDQMQT